MRPAALAALLLTAPPYAPVALAASRPQHDGALARRPRPAFGPPGGPIDQPYTRHARARNIASSSASGTNATGQPPAADLHSRTQIAIPLPPLPADLDYAAKVSNRRGSPPAAPGPRSVPSAPGARSAATREGREASGCFEANRPSNSQHA